MSEPPNTSDNIPNPSTEIALLNQRIEALERNQQLNQLDIIEIAEILKTLLRRVDSIT